MSGSCLTDKRLREGGRGSGLAGKEDQERERLRERRRGSGLINEGDQERDGARRGDRRWEIDSGIELE